MVLGVLGRRALLSTRTSCWCPRGPRRARARGRGLTCGSLLPLPAQCRGEADHTKGWEHTAAWPGLALTPGRCVLDSALR